MPRFDEDTPLWPDSGETEIDYQDLKVLTCMVRELQFLATRSPTRILKLIKSGIADRAVNAGLTDYLADLERIEDDVDAFGRLAIRMPGPKFNQFWSLTVSELLSEFRGLAATLKLNRNQNPWSPGPQWSQDWIDKEFARPRPSDAPGDEIYPIGMRTLRNCLWRDAGIRALCLKHAANLLWSRVSALSIEIRETYAGGNAASLRGAERTRVIQLVTLYLRERDFEYAVRNSASWLDQLRTDDPTHRLIFAMVVSNHQLDVLPEPPESGCSIDDPLKLLSKSAISAEDPFWIPEVRAQWLKKLHKLPQKLRRTLDAIALAKEWAVHKAFVEHEAKLAEWNSACADPKTEPVMPQSTGWDWDEVAKRALGKAYAKDPKAAVELAQKHYDQIRSALKLDAET